MKGLLKIKEEITNNFISKNNFGVNLHQTFKFENTVIYLESSNQNIDGIIDFLQNNFDILFNYYTNRTTIKSLNEDYYIESQKRFKTKNLWLSVFEDSTNDIYCEIKDYYVNDLNRF